MVPRRVGDGRVRTGSEVVAAAEAAWAEIQKRHPDVPDVVLVTGSGRTGRRLRWGHFCLHRWATDDRRISEVLLSGERLAGGPEGVLSTLLHEAAHGRAQVRGVTDTSGGGRYHNGRFRDLANAVGLEVTRQGNDGWAHTELAPPTVSAYAGTLSRLHSSLRIDGPPPGAPAGSGRKANPLHECGCPRKLRMSPKTAGEGPVLCGVCGEEFAEVER